MRPSIVLRAAPLLFAMTIPAFAQYPPPGIYRCNRNDEPLGTLVLNVAGDYQFIVAANSNFDAKPDDAGNGKGQLASAGTQVTPQSGPFKDIYKLAGAFETKQGVTKFGFKGDDGSVVTCEP